MIREMRIQNNQHGCFKQNLYFTKEEIDRMCLEALEKSGFLPDTPGPIRIERFIEKYFNCSVCYDNFGDRVMGVTAFRKDGSIQMVGVAASLDDGAPGGECRIRSTFAHEGGHCLMHPILFMDNSGPRLFEDARAGENFDFLNRRILCRQGDIKVGYDGKWWEYQANRAISGFLLPKKLIQIAVEQFLESVGSLGLKSLNATRFEQAKQHVALTFNVNPIVAEYRLHEMYPDIKHNSGSFL
jgi:hypothetical protein